MPNAITATIGADAAPLKKGLDDAKALARATSKQVADDAKKAVAEQKKAETELAAHRKELVNSAKASVGTVANGLTRAGAAGELVATGFEAIGAMAGPVAGVAVGIGMIATSMWNAREDARILRKEFTELARETQGSDQFSASSGELRGGASKIAEELRQRKLAKSEAIEKWGDWMADTSSNSFVSAVGEKTSEGMDNWFGGDAGPTAKDKQDDLKAAAMKERYRLLTQAADADKEDAAIVEQRVDSSDREAAIAARKLASIREIAAVTNQMTKEGNSPDFIGEVTAGMKSKADSEIADMERQGSEAWQEFGANAEDAAARGRIAVESVTSQLGAMKMELEQINKEADREKARAEAQGGHEERTREHLAKEQSARERALALTQQIAVAERANLAARVDSANAIRQSEISTVALTNTALGAKQQLALYEKQIADLAERRKNAEAGAVLAIDAQIAGVKAQEAALQHARNLLTPAQKQAQAIEERNAARQQRQNERVEKAHAADRARTAERNGGGGLGNNAVFFNQVHQVKEAKAAVVSAEFARALDDSEFRKEVRQLLMAPPRFKS